MLIEGSKMYFAYGKNFLSSRGFRRQPAERKRQVPGPTGWASLQCRSQAKPKQKPTGLTAENQTCAGRFDRVPLLIMRLSFHVGENSPP